QLTDLAAVYQLRGKPDLAERLNRDAVSIDGSLYGERHAKYANALVNLASTLAPNGKLNEADSLLRYSVEILRQVYPGGHPDLVAALRTWGMTLDLEHRYADAETPLRQAIAMARRFEGPDSPRVTDSEVDLSIALTMTGKFDEAVEVARDAKRILRLKY